jgi:acyl-CoA reductase-like NAD-dependent aldehyde dehydrogenase
MDERKYIMEGIISPKERSNLAEKILEPNSRTEMDRALDILTANKTAWVKMNIPDRITILEKIKHNLQKTENRLIALSLEAKGADYNTMGEAEEWGAITVVYRQIRFLRKSLKDIIRFGNPKIPGKVTTRPNGQVVAQVMPFDWKEKLALPGIRAEVWMDPSVSLQDGGIPQASFYHAQDKEGKVCTILAAGNFSSLIPGDLLYKLFVEGQVVALKMNPVNEYLGPIWKEIFSPLIKSGYLQILHGGVQEGSYLCNHSTVDSVHTTGSDKTFEAITFGPGAEGNQRKQARQPLLKKPFSAELGNISPVIVVPGPWTAKDIESQSARLGSWLVPNAGYGCLTPRMIIQMKGWEHRDKLNKAISNFLSKIKTRKAYYPGSFELHQQFINAHPHALQLGEPVKGHLPWTFIPDVDTQNEDDICFKCEPFMSLYSETALQASNVVEYISKAVKFANEKLWGTLVASIIVHPESMKDPEIAAAVDKATADLRYGSIVINNWGILPYYFSSTPWGGYPGSDIYDVQSGIGFVNNPLMFDCAEKSVCYTDFNPIADPFLANTTNNYLYFRQDTRFNHNPTVGNLLNLIWKAMTIKLV